MNEQPAGIGHNAIARDQLRSIVERVERLEEEKKALSDDVKEVYVEAKANGFDTKILRHLVRIRKRDTAKRLEAEALLETYMHALGMLADTPLGEAAVKRDFKPSAELKRAVGKLGTPVKPTPEEEAKGVKAAFVGKDGTRMSIAIPNEDGEFRP